jgi:hypothetical protein
MPTVTKCTKCNQFNREADEESDVLCKRCKKAIEAGKTELPDENEPYIKQRRSKPDDDIKIGSSE